jgi:membrane protein involved in colicin uptake
MTRYTTDAEQAPSNVTPAPDSVPAPVFDADGNVIEAVHPKPAPVNRETPEQEKERLETQAKLQAAKEQATLPNFVAARAEESKEVVEQRLAAVKEQREQAERDQKEQEEKAKQAKADADAGKLSNPAASGPVVPPSPDTASEQSNPEADRKAKDEVEAEDARARKAARRK